MLHILSYIAQKCYVRKPFEENNVLLGIVAHTFNPSTWEAEVGGSMSSRPAWSTGVAPEQLKLHSEILSEQNKKKKRIYFELCVMYGCLSL